MHYGVVLIAGMRAAMTAGETTPKRSAASVNQLTLGFAGAGYAPKQFPYKREREAFAMTIRRDNGAAPGRWGRTLRVGSSVWNAPAKTLASMHHSSHRTAWAGAAVALGAILFFYAVLYSFSNARLAALQQARDIAEQENHAFCEKHGMSFGTREHTSCVEDLMDIRANERQRTFDEFGVF